MSSAYMRKKRALEVEMVSVSIGNLKTSSYLSEFAAISPNFEQASVFCPLWHTASERDAFQEAPPTRYFRSTVNPTVHMVIRPPFGVALK